MKQSPEGEYLWAETVTVNVNALVITRALTTDKEGNIYLVSGA